jgi:tRNA U34 2-thiouridine synthase MnmA/TrmU
MSTSVAVAVSGGRDSMALLHCLARAAQAQGIEVNGQRLSSAPASVGRAKGCRCALRCSGCKENRHAAKASKPGPGQDVTPHWLRWRARRGAM